jgi:hypothetical protein
MEVMHLRLPFLHFLPRFLPHPPPLSVCELDRRNTEKKRHNLLTGEWWGWGRSQIIRQTARKPGNLLIIQYSLVVSIDCYVYRRN